jgi:hypothetical protein
MTLLRLHQMARCGYTYTLDSGGRGRAGGALSPSWLARRGGRQPLARIGYTVRFNSGDRGTTW